MNPATLFDLSGKAALVTGGSRGLGRQMVLAFAAAGANVVISSRKREACERVAAEVESVGRQALARPCHVGHWDELEGLVDDAYERFGRIDILVNNAGMAPKFDSLTDVSERMWDSVFALNVKGPFRLGVMVGTRMVRDGGGTIINVSASGTRHPFAGIAPYAAAKNGLNTITEALADAYGPTVRVNTLMPGPFLTDVSEHWDPSVYDHVSRAASLGRPGQPDEIVGAALFLASAASSYTTGSIVRVDGGGA